MAVLSHRSLSAAEIARILASLLTFALTVYFLFLSAHLFRFTPESMGKYFALRWVLIVHVIAGALALFSGPLLLWKRLRVARPVLHRRLGKMYLVLVALSGAAAVALSLTTARTVGWAYAFALQVWVGIWLTASWIAYRAARKQNFPLHEQWMTRSYLVLLAFVLGALLFTVPPVAALGTFAETSPSILWFSWAVPLYAYEAHLASRAAGRTRAMPQRGEVGGS